MTFAGVLSPTTATFTVATGQPGTTAQRFAYTGPPVVIPDNSATGATVTIPVTGVGYASKVTFAVDGTTCSEDPTSTTVGINHSFVGDLTGLLTSPAGTTVQVFARNGGTGENLCQVVFDDAAVRAFSTVLSADDPFTGTWRPIQPLAPLLDASTTGDWTFKVLDSAPADSGSIRAVSLSITGFVEG